MDKAIFEARTRSVLDPIHGLIRLTPYEMDVINHPLFRRLLQIKQNGLLYLVFPSATHTRFEHSLGAMFVAHGMLNSLALNSRAGLDKASVCASEDAQKGQAVVFPATGTVDHTFLYRVTRFAALVHDLGHGPLSHTFDSFAPKREQLARILKDPNLSSLHPLLDALANWGKKDAEPADAVANARIPHEVMSCIFFASIAADLRFPEELVQAVAGAILGAALAENLQNPLARKWVPLIHDLIASAPADADRMDYMERDSRAIGVTYGLFDRNRVLKSLLMFRDRHDEVRLRLGIKRSGLQALENLVQARYELFAQIYYHKTNRAVSRMLQAIADAAATGMELFGESPTLEGWSEKYLQLSDEQFLKTLRDPALASPEIRRIADDIHGRRLWKRILDPTTHDEAQRILETLRDEFPADADRLNLDESKPKALKDLKDGARLMMRRGRGAYEAVESASWTEDSLIIGSLLKADSQAVRLYLDSSESTNARAIRNRAREIAFDSSTGTNVTT